MSAQSHAEFPDAEYLILSSRLIPDRDGGYALATLARARQMAAGGVHDGLGPLLLTLDPGTPAEHARHRATFAGRDLVIDPARMRNLFDEAADPHGGAAAWLRAAVDPGEPDPALEYVSVPDAAGRPVVGLPVITGDPDWHITTAPVAVYDARGAVAERLAGEDRRQLHHAGALGGRAVLAPAEANGLMGRCGSHEGPPSGEAGGVRLSVLLTRGRARRYRPRPDHGRRPQDQNEPAANGQPVRSRAAHLLRPRLNPAARPHRANT